MMTFINKFDVVEARTSRVSDQNFGEPTRVRTIAAGVNARPSSDPARIDFETVGIFKVDGKQYSKGFKNVEVSGKEAGVSIDQRNLPVMLKQGDHIERPKTGVVYRIASIAPDGQGRTIFNLTVIASQAH